MVSQVRMFYPELQHPAFGVIRAILKDSTDNMTGTPSLVFLDSDDEVTIPLSGHRARSEHHK